MEVSCISSNMDVQSDFMQPTTPALSYNANYRATEDSGYHTSFTPGSVEYSDISSTHNDHDEVTPYNKLVSVRLSIPTNTQSSPLLPCSVLSPLIRRGVKRSYQDVGEDVSDTSIPTSSIPTPTSMIAVGIRRLKVNDIRSTVSSLSLTSEHSDYGSKEFYYLNENSENTISYPTTPVKRMCKSTCNISPMRKSAKAKLSFTSHSLLCSSNGLVKKSRPRSHAARTIQFRPEQKVDIIKMLKIKGALPAIKEIIGYLSNKDIQNFNSVSSVWSRIWNEESSVKEKMKYYNFLKCVKENQENIGTPKKIEICKKSLKEIQNVLNVQTVKDPVLHSPPGTPRTNKFKKFTKAASMDSRLQLLCVRCEQPAKVNHEASGEQWAECTSTSCSYVFCRSCNSDRHPGKSCNRYGLDGPSPSKRKRNSCAIGSMKSRKNLKRLL